MDRGRVGEVEAVVRQEDVVVKPMLTSRPSNFKRVPFPSSLKAKPGVGPTREDLKVEGSRCFLLNDLLTPTECQSLIDSTEAAGYTTLVREFPSSYRNNERVMSLDHELADALWKRIEPCLCRRDVLRVRPFGSGNHGTWKPIRVNECLKFGKYTAGQRFSPHLDGPWVPREDESSIYTVLIYLNSDYEGGSTNFLQRTNKSGDVAFSSSKDAVDSSERGEVTVVCKVRPKTGSALIFNHDTLHEGEAITRGVKYVLRTEVMFVRVDSHMLADRYAYQQEESYLRSLSLYIKSDELAKEGKADEFTDTYLEAIAVELKRMGSIGDDAGELDKQPLPYELYIAIFGLLSPPEVAKLFTVSRAWYDMAMDGNLWRAFFKKRWPLHACAERFVADGFLQADPFMKDWYGCFRAKVKSEQKGNTPIVFDFGSLNTKAALCLEGSREVATFEIESIYAAIPTLFDVHLRRCNWQRQYSGKAARESRLPTKRLVENGTPKFELLPELVTPSLFDFKQPGEEHPAVFVEPPFGWPDFEKEKLQRAMFVCFNFSSICIVNASVAALLNSNRISGIVVHSGHEVGCVTCVWAMEVLICKQFKPDDPAVNIGELICNAVDECRSKLKESKQEDELVNNIILSGGRTQSEGFEDKVKTEMHKAAKGKAFNVSGPENRTFDVVRGGCVYGLMALNHKNLELRGEKGDYMNELDYRVDPEAAFFYAEVCDWGWLAPVRTGESSGCDCGCDHDVSRYAMPQGKSN